MIDKKVILYVLVGVISFALWEAWQKDYKQGTPSAPTAVVSTAATSSQPTSEVVTKTTTAPAAEVAAPVIPAERLVKVHTDVLDVAIDTLGGNIVQADLLKYPALIYKEKPVRLLSEDTTKYYVTNSGLISAQGPDTTDKRAQYSSAKKEYRLSQDKENLQVTLSWKNKQGLLVNKIFVFTKGKYEIGVDYKINNNSNQRWAGQFFAEVKRKNFEPSKGLFNFSTYTGAAISSPKTPYEKISFSDITKTVKNKNGLIQTSMGGWAAMQQRYFLSVWIPAQDQVYNYFAGLNDGVYTIGFADNKVSAPARTSSVIGSKLYVGPEVAENLEHLANGLDRTVDYGWLWIVSSAFFWILKSIYKLVGNWGWSIILITILIKGAFYKLSESSCRSMARMRELMPKMQALKERYGDDKQKLQQATMELYKREKVNPLNLGGCLPMLIQIPFFIALYYVLISAVELRHSPFMFWIHDLSARDPYYVLPVLMGLSMFLQQKLSPTSADPAQAKVMMLMPVVFTFFFLNFPSGLVLYWLMSNLLSILQQWYINKKITAGGCRR